jgi:predicted amidohydrolase
VAQTNVIIYKVVGLTDDYTHLSSQAHVVCSKLVHEAASEGAALVCLPECCLYIGGSLYTDPTAIVPENIAGHSMAAFQNIAASAKVQLMPVVQPWLS